MEWLTEILGFVVLTGPLVAILIWLPISLLIAVKLGKRFRGAGVKAVGGLVIFAIAFLLPFVDEIAGRVYLKHLCETEAGVKVYQTVELPAEYWDEEGKPRFQVYNKANDTVARFIMGSYQWEDSRFEYRSFTESYLESFNIDKAGFRFSESESKNILGEIIYFRFWGGWIRRNFSINNASYTCQLKNLDEWKFSIFRPLRHK